MPTRLLASIAVLSYGAPGGFVPCDGSRLDADANGMLSSVLGTTYDGEGESDGRTVRVPHLAPLAAGRGPVDFAMVVAGVHPDPHLGMDKRLLGEVAIVHGPWGSAPENWLPCDGSTVSTSARPDLFSVIGQTFGGDPGEGTFALPDLSFETTDGIAIRPCIAAAGFSATEMTGDHVYLGELKLAASSLGKAWLPCDGSVLPTREYASLHMLVGDRFGDPSGKEFALPDLPPITTTNGGTLNWYIAVYGSYPERGRPDY